MHTHKLNLTTPTLLGMRPHSPPQHHHLLLTLLSISREGFHRPLSLQKVDDSSKQPSHGALSLMLGTTLASATQPLSTLYTA